MKKRGAGRKFRAGVRVPYLRSQPQMPQGPLRFLVPYSSLVTYPGLFDFEFFFIFLSLSLSFSIFFLINIHSMLLMLHAKWINGGFQDCKIGY